MPKFVSVFASKDNARINVKNNAGGIGENVFAFCSNLKSITIPVSFNYAETSAFYASGLTTINYRGTEEEWNAIEGIADAEIPEDCVINYNYKGE